jgi:CBS domain-containing protein
MTRPVRDVMTRTVVVAAAQTPFKELVRMLREYRVSAVPVVGESGTIVGVVSEGDLLLHEDPAVLTPRFLEGHERKVERHKAEGVLARDLMTAPPVTIGPDATTTEAAHLMHERHVKRLPVVDGDGTILGVISRVDLLLEYLRDDEEILGEVRRILTEELVLTPDSLRVSVEEGVVSLEGQVERRTLVPAIWDRIRNVEGVVGVDERLVWDVDDTTAVIGPVPWVGL